MGSTSLCRLSLLGVLLLSACQPIHGAGFDFPEAAPTPKGTSVLATGEGSDDDNPIRSRQQVVELEAVTEDQLLAYYEAAYPASRGWKTMETRGRQQLCLINRENPDYAELVEVFEYAGARVAPTPTRRLVSVSRIENRSSPICGRSLVYMNTDLS